MIPKDPPTHIPGWYWPIHNWSDYVEQLRAFRAPHDPWLMAVERMRLRRLARNLNVWRR